MKTSAARAAVVRDWTQVATRYPSAPAKTPVTTSAYQTVPPRGSVELAAAIAIAAKHGTRDRHLQERQRPRVVARREPLHRDDLERLGDGVAEHERVARRRPAGHAVEQQRARSTASATPTHAAAATGVRKSASARSGVRTT